MLTLIIFPVRAALSTLIFCFRNFTFNNLLCATTWIGITLDDLQWQASEWLLVFLVRPIVLDILWVFSGVWFLGLSWTIGVYSWTLFWDPNGRPLLDIATNSDGDSYPYRVVDKTIGKPGPRQARRRGKAPKGKEHRRKPTKFFVELERSRPVARPVWRRDKEQGWQYPSGFGWRYREGHENDRAPPI